MQRAAELLRDMGHERSSRMGHVDKERSRSFKIFPCLPFLEGRAESAPTSFKNLLNDGVTLAEHIDTINLAIRGSFILLFWSEHAEILLLAGTKVLCTYTRNLTLQGRSTGPMKHWEKKHQTRYLHSLNNASCCALTRTWDTHQMGISAEP